MTKTFVITVLNVNEAPQSLTLKSSSGPDDYPRVDENVPINTVVGLIQAFDQVSWYMRLLYMYDL